MHLRVEGQTLDSGLTHLTFITSEQGVDFLKDIKQALHDLEAVNAPLEVWSTPDYVSNPSLTITLPVFANGPNLYGNLMELVDMDQLTSSLPTPSDSFRQTVWVERQITPTHDTEMKKSAALTYYKMPEWQDGIRCFGLTHMWPWTTLGIYALGQEYMERCEQLAQSLVRWINASERRIPLRCIQHKVGDKQALVIHIAMYCFKPNASYQLLMWDPRSKPPKGLGIWKGYRQQGSLAWGEKRMLLLEQGHWPVQPTPSHPHP